MWLLLLLSPGECKKVHDLDGHVWLAHKCKPTVRTVLQLVLRSPQFLAQEVFDGGSVPAQRIVRRHEPAETAAGVTLLGSRHTVLCVLLTCAQPYLSLAKVYISSLSSMNFFHLGFSVCRSL